MDDPTCPMNQPTGPKKPHPPVTLRQMPDGSYRIYGLRYPNRVGLTRELRSWRRDCDEQTGQTYFTSWDRTEAETYAAAHGLTILAPTAS